MKILRITNENSIKYKKEIVNLLSESYSLNFCLTELTSKNIAELKYNELNGYLENKSTFLLGAIENETVVGIIWAYIYKSLQEERLHINQVVVSDRYRRHGLGKKMMYEAEKIADANHIKTIDLNVSKSNQTALDLYKKLGFCSERILMKKSLGESK